MTQDFFRIFMKISTSHSMALLFPLIFGGSAEGRFFETDESLIDQEERYNTETYNDKYSYRFPVGWYRLFDESDAAVRIHAGSLNASRFDYSEEIKFFVANEAAGFSFFQARNEDVLEQVTAREVRMNGFFPGPVYISMLADGGSFKEYGDMGWAVGFGHIKRPVLELVYWSVDHFYDTKKSDEGDKRSKQTSTVAGRSHLAFSDELTVVLRGEYDHPLIWERPSRGYTYEYVRKSAGTSAVYKLAPEQSLVLDLSWSKKRESKSWYDIKYAKKMDREVRISELKWIEEGIVEHAVGVAYVDRRVSYEQSGSALDTPDSLPEELSPEHSKRDEFVLFGTRYEPLSGDRHYMQYGLHLNYVNLKETRHDRVFESKAQWAWEYRYTKNARVLFNTSWDINQLTDDFPFDERPFRPWGGGDIQFIAAF
jgi:hypothetical protein